MPCHGDVFHPEKLLHELCTVLARRVPAYTAAGPPWAAREELYDFIVTELERYQGDCPRRIKPLVRPLRNQRTALLAFVPVLQEKLARVAQGFGVPVTTVPALCEIEALDPQFDLYWQRTAHWQTILKDQWYPIHQAVLEAMAQTPRAGSLVGNRNSRLRGSFFLRRQIGPGYLDLLRFYLNHRRFPRSDRPERVGQSPAELLTGQTHPHWLELLGYTRFRRN